MASPESMAALAPQITPLGISRTFNENERAPIRLSDIVVSATVISTTAVILATVPAGENWRIEHLAFRNVTSGAVELRVFLVPSGGGPAAATNGVYVQSVPAAATVLIDGAIGYQLAEGETLQAVAITTANSFVAFGRLSRITQGSA